MKLNLTLTSSCSSRCRYCPHSVYRKAAQNNPQFFTLNEYMELVSAIREMNPDEISFGGFSEPFENPEASEIIKYTDSLNLAKKILIYTNGYFLTPEVLSQISIVDIQLLDISCHSFSPNIYSHTRPNIDPLKVKQNVFYLIKNRKNIRDLNLSLTGPFLTREDESELYALSKQYNFNLHFRELHNRAGLVHIGKVKKKEGPFLCLKDSFKKPVLIPGGDLVLCCQDFALKYVLGNLHHQELKYILETSPARKHILDVAKGKVIDNGILCYQCIFCKPVPHIPDMV